MPVGRAPPIRVRSQVRFCYPHSFPFRPHRGPDARPVRTIVRARSGAGPCSGGGVVGGGRARLESLVSTPQSLLLRYAQGYSRALGPQSSSAGPRCPRGPTDVGHFTVGRFIFGHRVDRAETVPAIGRQRRLSRATPRFFHGRVWSGDAGKAQLHRETPCAGPVPWSLPDASRSALLWDSTSPRCGVSSWSAPVLPRMSCARPLPADRFDSSTIHVANSHGCPSFDGSTIEPCRSRRSTVASRHGYARGLADSSCVPRPVAAVIVPRGFGRRAVFVPLSPTRQHVPHVRDPRDRLPPGSRGAATAPEVRSGDVRVELRGRREATRVRWSASATTAVGRGPSRPPPRHGPSRAFPAAADWRDVAPRVPWT